MKPVVLITTDAAASRFDYHWYSAGTRRSPPVHTYQFEGQPAKPGEARPALSAKEVEQLRLNPTGDQP